MKIVIGKVSNDFGCNHQDVILFINDVSFCCIPVNKIEDNYFWIADVDDNDLDRLGEYLNAKENVRT